MRERGIIFSGEMVKALLAGTKTQTRRIVKFDPLDGFDNPNCAENLARCNYGVAGDRLWVRETFAQYAFRNRAPRIVYRADNELHGFKGWKPSIFMPRKLARIWLEITGVRVERLQEISNEDSIAEGLTPQRACRQCPEQNPEPLPLGTAWSAPGSNTHYPPEMATWAYRYLWDSLHGKGAWELNPWVFVIEFRRMTQ